MEPKIEAVQSSDGCRVLISEAVDDDLFKLYAAITKALYYRLISDDVSEDVVKGKIVAISVMALMQQHRPQDPV